MNLNQYVENIYMGLDTLRSHKMRSFLTVLGVIIGVLTVIVISSILTGMRQSIINLVEEYGTQNIYAFHLSTGPHVGRRDRQEWQRKPLTVEDAEAIRREASAIEDVSYQAFGFSNPTVKYRDKSYRQAQLQGVSPHHGAVTNIALCKNERPPSSDRATRTTSSTFPIAPLGASIRRATSCSSSREHARDNWPRASIRSRRSCAVNEAFASTRRTISTSPPQTA
ncbi:MAG: ABC transporter permease [Acidobacteriota bacterium]